MEKNVYVGSEAGTIKAPNPPKQTPKVQTIEGKDLRSVKKGGGK